MKFYRWFSASILLLVLAVVPVSADSVLIVAADPSGYPTAELLARGFSTVDTFDSTSGTPTLALLSGYSAVLAYTDFIPANGTALGDVLADYVDAGGRVSLDTYSFSTPWEIGGRIMTAGYSPLVNIGANGSVTGLFVPVLPLDPLFNGVGAVTYFNNGNFALPALDAGATLLATDGSGVIMAARNGAGNVVGLNLYPSTTIGGNNEAFYDLIANSLRSSSAEVVPLPPAALGGIVIFAAMIIQYFARRNTVPC